MEEEEEVAEVERCIKAVAEAAEDEIDRLFPLTSGGRGGVGRRGKFHDGVIGDVVSSHRRV